MHSPRIRIASIILVPTTVLLTALCIWPSQMLSEFGVGLATWLGLLAAVVGLPLALWGVMVAVREARAAAAAADAARTAISSLRHFSDVAGLAYENAQLQALHQAITRSAFAVAEVMFLTTKRSLLLHAAGQQNIDAPTLQRSIATVEAQIRRGVTSDPLYDQSRALSAVNGLIRHVTNWESDMVIRSEQRSATHAVN